MNARLALPRTLFIALVLAGAGAACSAPDAGGPAASGSASGAAGRPSGGSGGSSATGGSGGGATGGGSGTGGVATGGTGGTGGSAGSAEGGASAAGGRGGSGGSALPPDSGGAMGGRSGAGGTGGRNVADASTVDASGRSGAAGASGNADAAVVVPGNCTLPATVSFQRDVQPFLIASCGGTGCHVVDASSTMSAGGYNHGYDWVTAGAHASSCPETPTPKRFEVVLAVINGANPASCSRSRKMPPPAATGARTALTPCQIATLQAWLNEPPVTQTHRADDSSPTTPYAMPPFN